MKINIDDVKEKYSLWWNKKGTKPVFYLIFPDDERDVTTKAPAWAAPAIKKQWSNWQQEMIIAQALDLSRESNNEKYLREATTFLREYAHSTEYAMEGYPFLLPGFGPGVLTALLTGYAQFKKSTVWFEVDPPQEWDDLFNTIDSFNEDYYAWYKKVLSIIIEDLQEHFVIAMPDIGGVLDILAGIHGNQNLLMNLIMSPDKVKKAIEVIEKKLYVIYKETADIIAPGNHGCYAETMRYLSEKPTHIGICDFSAMISPDHFAEFCLPLLQREAEHWDDRYVYHMDGPGQVPHLDHLLAIEKLHAIQWVPGAGNPTCLDESYYEMYKKILDSGKYICFGGADAHADAYKALFKKFPKEAFFVPITFGEKKKATEFVKEINSII